MSSFSGNLDIDPVSSSLASLKVVLVVVICSLPICSSFVLKPDKLVEEPKYKEQNTMVKDHNLMTAGNSSFLLTTWFCCLYVQGFQLLTQLYLQVKREIQEGLLTDHFHCQQSLFKDSVSACMCGMACGCQ